MICPDQQRRFLDLVRQGPGIIAFKPRDGAYFERHFTDHESAVALIRQFGGSGDTWVSMGTYPERGSREAANAKTLCAFWLDVDAHGERSKHSSVIAAREAVEAFIDKTGLPKPSATHLTGHGVHVLWAFTEAIERLQWQTPAEKLQLLAKRLELGADPITGDAARILRVAGTINFRDPADPRPCTLVPGDDRLHDFDDLHARLDEALADHPPPMLQHLLRPLPKSFEAPETPENVAIVRSMLALINPDPDYLTWRNLVWAVAATGWSSSYDLARTWSKKGDKWREDTFEAVWGSFAEKDGGITFGTLVHHARSSGYKGPLPSTQSVQNQAEALAMEPAADAVTGSRLITRCAADIDPEHIEWLVPESLPLGMLAVVGGEPGLGKSQIAIALAAAVTAGMELPGGAHYGKGGSVVILANEDDAARTIRPRLEAAGADVRKVHIVEGVAREGAEVDLFQLDQDVAELRGLAMRLGDVRLIVIDPPTGYLGSKVDSYKESDVRRVLLPLNTLAQETGALILLVVHLNKRSEGGPQQRFSGSTAWIAAPRAGFIVAEDQTDKRRYMLPAKVNVGNDRLGYEYRVKEEVVEIKGEKFVTSKIVWTGTTDKPARDLLSPPKAERTSAVDDAADFLRDELAERPLPVKELQARAKQAGISWASVQRARKECMVIAEKMTDHWQWKWLGRKPEGLLDE